MENNKVKICLLCLNAKGDFVNIDASIIGKLKLIVPELAGFPNDGFVCSKCMEMLEKSLEFQKILSKTKEFIQSEKNKSNCEKIDLNSIIKAAGTNSNTKVCRICLERGPDFTIIGTEKDDVLITVLQNCLPDVDLDVTIEPIVCDSCRDCLLEAYNFKKDCAALNDRMKSNADDESDDKFDLSVLNRIEEEIDFLSGFEVQDEDGDIFAINLQSEDNSKKRTADDSAEKERNVKKVKLVPDQAIVNDTSKAKLAVNKVKLEPDNVTPKKKPDVKKIKIVSDKMIVDDTPKKKPDIKKKLTLDKTSTDDSVKKNQNVKKLDPLAHEVIGEELPPFHFNSNLLYNPNKVGTMQVEDWLELVERYKQKYNWSDIATIHKVLVNLKDMPELHVWFSNIADIMDWEQWKKKLLRAFPGRNDFYMDLRRIMLRKKRKDDTYVTYFQDKMQYMEPLNLTDEQKVSCIFGGMTDVLVGCVGRVGDYKSPAEVLEYLKSCDEKQTLEALSQDANPSANQEKVSPKQQQKINKAALLLLKKNKKCFICNKMGHVRSECRFAHKVGTTMNSSNPEKVRCTWCGQAHPSDICTKKFPGNNFQAGPPPPVNIERCSICRKTNHVTEDCYRLQPTYNGKGSARSQKFVMAKNAVGWSHCRDCGKFSNNENPCPCRARMASNGTFSAPFVPNPDYKKQLCQRCYKPGHLTKDCQEFARKMYRK